MTTANNVLVMASVILNAYSKISFEVANPQHLEWYTEQKHTEYPQICIQNNFYCLAPGFFNRFIDVRFLQSDADSILR